MTKAPCIHAPSFSRNLSWIFVGISLLLSSLPCGAQTCNPSCFNSGFQNGDLSGWNAYYAVNGSSSSSISFFSTTGGPCGSVKQSGGPDPNTWNNYQVTLMTTASVDPIAGALIPLIPPLGGICARIGDGVASNYGVGILEQTYTVDSANPLLTVQYAVVFENPGHYGYQQPLFEMEVLDQNGTPIPGNGQYLIYSSSGLPGFKGVFYPTNGDSVYCKPWTTIIVPLQNYIGQCVTVKFTATDCALGGHFGYAYVTASCGKPKLLASSNIFCSGQQSATITAPISNGTYSWTTVGGCISGPDTLRMLKITCGGTYNLIATSGNYTDTFSITIPASSSGPPPIPCFTASYVCSGNPTQFDATCSNPNTGTTFYWDFYNNGQFEDSSGINPVWTYTAGGTYSVKLHEVDSNSCSADTVITVKVDPIIVTGKPTIAYTKTDVTACGQRNGSIKIFLSGNYNIRFTTPTAPCTNGYIDMNVNGGSSSTTSSNCVGVSIINGSITLTFNGLAPGSYCFYFKPKTLVGPSPCDSNGYHGDTLCVTVKGPGNMTGSLTIHNATCGTNNGSVTASVLGGTPPYTYSWTGGGTVATKTGLGPGNYSVTITDSYGCVWTSTYKILALNYIPINASTHNASCNGAQDGFIVLTPMGGMPPYTYSWVPNVSTTDSAGGLGIGVYSFYITDAAGCTGNDSVLLTDIPITTINFKWKDSLSTTCFSPGCSYQWFKDGIPTCSDSPICISSGVGNYFVVVTDDKGCSSTSSPFVVNGVPENEKLNFFSVRPNPNNGKFALTFSKVMINASLKIFNVMGKEVYSEMFRGEEKIVDLALSKGIYFVQINAEDNQWVQKVIIE